MAALLLCACGRDEVARLKELRHPVAPARPLGELLGACPLFTRVAWSATPRHDGSTLARATGIFNLDALVGKTAQGRSFTAQDRAALAKAGANLCYVLEYDFGRDAPQGRQAMQAVMLVTMDWTQPAPLQSDALLGEVASGVAGPALLAAATDAAAYCRARLSVPERK
ncbi:hypothetical protein [Fundidesulfovibrio agrisoli]|uniref:hypothetical protein n=1 Tax=Fundidesulfovibrio agrisoli TaxID=2922717 RepID=UPI001FAC3F8E|nr:hypothetical protein [Fundidesulfovibrio agrisoli]